MPMLYTYTNYRLIINIRTKSIYLLIKNKYFQVIVKNDTVESSPSLINKSCFEEGWLFKVKLSSPEELQQLMDQSAYDKYLEESH